VISERKTIFVGK